LASEIKFLALDLGAESGRAVVGLFDGGRVRLEEARRFPNGPVCVGGRLYWDVLRLFEEMKLGVAASLENYGKDIRSLGIDTWGVDFGLVAADGELLANPRHYRDPRTNGMMEAVFQLVPKSRVYEETGIQFMQVNTLYQLFAMAKEGSPLLACADTLLMMPDLFNFWFAGVRVSEFSIATTTQFYNPRKSGWATGMLAELGIPNHFLPDIIPPGTPIGQLAPSVAEELSAPNLTVTAPASHDTASAVAAVPAEVKDYAYISSGTWSLMGVELDRPLINQKALELNFTNEGGVGGTFRFLKNIMGLWLVQECRRTWAKTGRDYSYQELTDMAAAEKPFSAIVDPDHPAFLQPGDMPSRIRDFCERTGQRPPESDGAVIRAALDSLALKYRHTLDALEELLGRPMEVIHIVGGGSQNRLLNQLAADVTARPVIAGPVEATALGNVLVQAIAAGEIGSLAEAREVVRQSCSPQTYEPRPDSGADEAYARFRSLLGAR